MSLAYVSGLCRWDLVSCQLTKAVRIHYAYSSQ
jgi:hypothetical protein